MRPRTMLGWSGALGALACTGLLALALWRSLVLLSGYPPPMLQTSDENDGYEILVVFSVLIGLMMLAVGALTVLALWSHHRVSPKT